MEFYTNTCFCSALGGMSERYCLVEVQSLIRVLLIQTHCCCSCDVPHYQVRHSTHLSLFLSLLSLLPECSVRGRHNSLEYFADPMQAAPARSIPPFPPSINSLVANPRGLTRSTWAPGSALPKLSKRCWASYSPWVVGWGLPTLIPQFHSVSTAFPVHSQQQLPFDF